MPSTPPTSRTPAVLEAVAAFALMAVAAVLGTVAHQGVAGTARWPSGLLLALLLAACCALFVRAACTSTAARWGAVLGWVVGLLATAQSRPGGDVLVPADTRGYAWLLVSLGLVVLLLAAPAGWFRPLPGRAARTGRG